MFHNIPFVIGLITGAAMVRERRRRQHVERLGAAALETLLDAIDANSPETGAHVRRVAHYALVLADFADLDDRECHAVERVALFHDIGKIDGAVSDIVELASSLTPDEREAIRTHPQRGADVLKPLDAFYPELSRGVLAHHECWDGSGYPHGLSGTAIPIAARIVTIVDTFDAITHTRSYSAAKSVAAASEIISRGRGAQFDPELVDLFLSPPVMEKILESVEAAPQPRTSDKPRSSSPKHETPDINFRWRKPSPALRRADRQPRRPKQ
jgi:putative two-component system response regulator